MEKVLLLLAMLFVISGNIAAQETDNGKRLMLITLDGYRLQELFGGTDQELLNNEKYDSDISTMKSRFLRGFVEENRKALMSFIWTYAALKKNVMIGNVLKNSKMHVACKINFPYSDYNEDLKSVYAIAD